MIALNVSRRLRLYSVYRCFGSVLISDAQQGRAFPVVCSRTLSGKQAVRWSKSNLRNEVESRCPISHFSTANPSDNGKLIYTGSLGNAVRGVKLFSYSSSGLSLILMPQIFLQTGLGGVTQATFCCVIGFFTFFTPVLLHLLTKGYVVRLYHNAETDIYTAVTYSVVLTEKRTVFHQNQVKIPAVSKMFTTFYADKKGLLVNPDRFPLPHDYNHLMGYDQPFSFDEVDMEKPEKS